MTLGLSVAVATGGDVLGTEPVERGEVLCLALEDNRRRLQKRLASCWRTTAALKGSTLPSRDPGWTKAVWSG